MLRLLETLLYRAECRSIIVGRIINVVNHGRGPAFVWQTRNYFCHRYTTVMPTTSILAASLWRPKPPWGVGNAHRVGTRRQLSPHVVDHPPKGADIGRVRLRTPVRKDLWTFDRYWEKGRRPRI